MLIPDFQYHDSFYCDSVFQKTPSLAIPYLILSRFLYLSSVAEKRGRSMDVSDLEELLLGCTQLEVRFHFSRMDLQNDPEK